jgi:hypothetical protein
VWGSKKTFRLGANLLDAYEAWAERLQVVGHAKTDRSAGAFRRSSISCGSDLNSTTQIYSRQGKKKSSGTGGFSFLIS